MDHARQLLPSLKLRLQQMKETHHLGDNVQSMYYFSCE